MSKLDIAKKIAEIEGIKVYTGWISHNEQAIKLWSSLAENDYIYNPFDWSVLGPLMVKYQVSIDYEEKEVIIYGMLICDKNDSSCPYSPHVSFIDDLDIPRAILECIIKSQE